MTNTEILYRAFLVEATTRLLVLEGITDYKKLTKKIEYQFQPATEEEMEIFSEAIVYARCSILN